MDAISHAREIGEVEAEASLQEALLMHRANKSGKVDSDCSEI